MKNYKEQFISIIEKHLPTCKIYLFGSRARKDNSSVSDYDIALNDNKKIPKIILSNIKEDFEESTIPFYVDVVDLHDAPENLKKDILSEGILWKS